MNDEIIEKAYDEANRKDELFCCTRESKDSLCELSKSMSARNYFICIVYFYLSLFLLSLAIFFLVFSARLVNEVV